MTVYKNSINFCYWNIGGLYTHNTNKSDDVHFIKEIQNYDIVILAETLGIILLLLLKILIIFLYAETLQQNGRYYGGLAEKYAKSMLKYYLRRVKIISG
jgi:hypothetical protein